MEKCEFENEKVSRLAKIPVFFCEIWVNNYESSGWSLDISFGQLFQTNCVNVAQFMLKNLCFKISVLKSMFQKTKKNYENTQRAIPDNQDLIP